MEQKYSAWGQNLGFQTKAVEQGSTQQGPSPGVSSRVISSKFQFQAPLKEGQIPGLPTSHS